MSGFVAESDTKTGICFGPLPERTGRRLGHLQVGVSLLASGRAITSIFCRHFAARFTSTGSA